MSLHLVAGCSHRGMRTQGPSSDAEEVICVAKVDFLAVMDWKKRQGAGVGSTIYQSMAAVISLASKYSTKE